MQLPKRQLPDPMNKHNTSSGHISRGSQTQGQPIPPAPSLRRALLRLLPQDHYSTLFTLGLLAGIWMYLTHQDSWLLSAFLGIIGGSTIEKVRKK
jgi:hypothetical protein